MLTKTNELANLQALLPYAHNGGPSLIIAKVSDLFDELSPIDNVSNIEKLIAY